MHRFADPVIVHRSRFEIPVSMIGNARTVAPAWALVGSWELLTGAAARAPVIVAVRNRVVQVGEIRSALMPQTRLRRRSELAALLTLIEAGCQSELELWGYTNVFNVAELRAAIRQRTVVVRGRTFRLDLAYEEERVAVELDGRAFHALPGQWERDIARDLALATAGWQTIRLSHRRLTTDVEGYRRDVAAVLRQRRQHRSAASTLV